VNKNPHRLKNFALMQVANCISIKVKSIIFQNNTIVGCLYCENGEWDDRCMHTGKSICCASPPYIQRLLDGELIRISSYKFVGDERKILEILIVSFLRIECRSNHRCLARNWLEIRVDYSLGDYVHRRYILGLNEETQPKNYFHMMYAFEHALETKVTRNSRTKLSKSE
jgi:hypothetical protein